MVYGMRVSTNHNIDETFIFEISLSKINPGGLFPNEIWVCDNNDSELVYTPLIKSDIMVTMIDEDCAIGHCECSNCKESVNFFDKYCYHCGAKLMTRKILS